MARDENPPFNRGETFYGGATPDATDLGGVNLEGKEWVFEDVNPTTGVARTGREVRCRVVRNVSGFNLIPKRLVNLDTGNGTKYPGSAAGYASGFDVASYPTDEYLPSAGVVDDDLFYVVIEGPAVCVTGSTTDAVNIMAVGDWVTNATFNTTTGNTTAAGKIGVAQTTGATRNNLYLAINGVGRALSANATSGTGSFATEIVVDVNKW